MAHTLNAGAARPLFGTQAISLRQLLTGLWARLAVPLAVDETQDEYDFRQW